LIRTGKESLSILNGVTSFLRPLPMGPMTIFSPICPQTCNTSNEKFVGFKNAVPSSLRNTNWKVPTPVIL